MIEDKKKERKQCKVYVPNCNQLRVYVPDYKQPKFYVIHVK